MMLIDWEVKESSIAQKGLFTKQFIKKGTIISFFVYEGIKYITEDFYQQEQEKGNTLMVKTGCRYVGQYFLWGTQIEAEEHFNHSFTPNTLYHCGIAFALRDIECNEELTMDYHYLLAYEDTFRFTDKNSNRVVDGLKGTKALVESAKELIKLYEDTDFVDSH